MDLLLLVLVIILDYYLIKAIFNYHLRLIINKNTQRTEKPCDSSERAIITSLYYSSYKYLA